MLYFWKHLQIQPYQFPGYIQDTYFKNSRRFLHDKPYNVRMQVKFVMSMKEHVLMSSDQCSHHCAIQPAYWFMNNKPEDFPTYSILKIASRAKIALPIRNFSRSINQFQEISSISRNNFKLEETSGICRSCRHADRRWVREMSDDVAAAPRAGRACPCVWRWSAWAVPRQAASESAPPLPQPSSTWPAVRTSHNTRHDITMHRHTDTKQTM